MNSNQKHPLETYSHNDKLQFASYKVNDVQKLIEVYEWKLKHDRSTFQLSVLSSIGRAMLTLLIAILCCCCCCRNCWAKFLTWDWNNSKCSTIIFKPRIINSLHTSIDSLHRRGAILRLATHIDDECGESKNLFRADPL
jgi:hypothetical protein